MAETSRLRECSIPKCGRGGKLIRGWCGLHYKRWRRNGDPLGGRPSHKTLEEAFAGYTERRGDCLIWTGPINADGYGWTRVGGEHVFAHRYAWEREHGPIPEGLVIDHRHHCDHACVEHTHLRPATRQENRRHLAGAQANNLSTGVRNVSRCGGRFRVRLKIDGLERDFGHFGTLEEAAGVADRARAQAFGAFAGKPQSAATQVRHDEQNEE